jgi:hypothetical protein
MDVPVGNLLVLFVLALAGLAVVMGVVARAFVDHRRGLGYALGVLFVLAWLVHLFTGWQEFVPSRLLTGSWPPSGARMATPGRGWHARLRTS